MTISEKITRQIISDVIKSQDHRLAIVEIINKEFMTFAIDFFKEVANAKLEDEEININWYKKHFLDSNLDKNEIAINSGLNLKTIDNIHRTTAKSVVVDASNEHFNLFYKELEDLTNTDKEIDINLTIKFRQVSVELNINESLLVINTLAVKRSQIRGGIWSATGKGVEKYLMLTLCKLFKVEEKYYSAEHFIKDNSKAVDREVDFYLISPNGSKHRCEVKLMGKGNPESADAIFARQTEIFIADTLSIQNKNQSDALGVIWVACKERDGYKRFTYALDKFNIPYTDYKGNLDKDLSVILDEVFV